MINKKIKKKLLIYILLLIITLITYLYNDYNSKNIQPTIKDNTEHITIHYIDVGQGDSTFIELPNNETMLIDSGEKEYSEKVIKYIEDLKYDKINYVVGTHPHSDHVGGLQEIISIYDVDNIYLPNATTNTNTYLNLLKKIKEKNINTIEAKKDTSIIDTEDLNIEILSPMDEKYENLNNYSIIIRIKFKEKIFLFMGDAEKMIEKKLDDKLIKADVLKVGHHGSDTSTSSEFLTKVNPSISVISVGKNNMYKHPSKKTINLLKKKKIDIYRTDKDGNIIIESDGIELKVEKEKNNENNN